MCEAGEDELAHYLDLAQVIHPAYLARIPHARAVREYELEAENLLNDRPTASGTLAALEARAKPNS